MDTSYDIDVQDATILRTLSLMCDSWENDDLSIPEMTHQINEACKVVDGTFDFHQFTESTNLTGRERLS